MILTYHGHSCFKLKGKLGTVVVDPFSNSVGFSMPNLSADIVTISHDNSSHNNYGAISGTSRRKNPFIVNNLGEYEVGGISVFGVKTSQVSKDEEEEKRENRIFTIIIDGVRVCHLGELGHNLTAETIKEIGAVDVLLLPVGGVYTINAKQAVAAVKSLEPGFIVPMHFKTSAHDAGKFGELQELSEFVKEFGAEKVETVDKLKVEKDRLPEEKELVIIERT